MSVQAWTSAAIACSVYGISMMFLFASSSLHHAVKSEKDAREMLRRLDHISIYCFIAGTYTPLCIVTVDSVLGPRILKIIWTMALAGVCQKVFFKVPPSASLGSFRIS
jgi:hemolysin III